MLHCLWSKAVGTPDYDKAEWMELQRYIERLEDANKRLATEVVRLKRGDFTPEECRDVYAMRVKEMPRGE